MQIAPTGHRAHVTSGVFLALLAVAAADRHCEAMQAVPTEACCFPDGSCLNLPSVGCTAGGGVPQGPGTACEGMFLGYVAQDCGSPFEDISGTGIEAPNASNVDDAGDVVPIGFTFSFFGDDHNTIGVCSNGYLTFGSDLSDFTNDPIPTAEDPNDLIAPWWDDWSPNQAGTVHYQTLGTAPSRRFIAQWTGVPHFNIGGAATFQAVLFEGSNCIEFRYGDALVFDSPTVGVENADGTDGTAVNAGGIGPGSCVELCGESAAGVDCPTTGACCFPDGSCGQLSQDDCAASGGAYQGTGTMCEPGLCPPPKGACCFPDGMCAVVEAEECAAAGGDFQGDFTVCAPGLCPLPEGACCMIDGTCVNLTQPKCVSAGGLYQGDGTVCAAGPGIVCPPTEGACCLPGGTCVFVQWFGECDDLGGAFAGIGVTCADVVCPTNDDCKEALPVFNGLTPYSNLSATTDGPTASPCSSFGSDVWFEYTAQFSGPLLIALCDSNFDTMLEVYDNCGCPAMVGSRIACNDDACGVGGLRSQVNVSVCAGQCYKIRIGGFGGAQGFGTIEIKKAMPALCGSPEAGNCFWGHGNCDPFCNNEKCCNTVCAIDEYCCEVTWDTTCASEALLWCGDCGQPGAGNCYADNGTPGCNDADCCQTVCQIDAYCCHVEWDSVCADEAQAQCQGPGIPCPGEGACRDANGTPGCEDQDCCELVCNLEPACCEMAWDQACADIAIELCPNLGGCPGEGDCFAANNSPGCEEEACCTLVCDQLPECCDVEWDQDCADTAVEQCVVTCPGDGDCYQAHGTPGCDDFDCCKAVCDQDEFCCLIQWDEGCAKIADDVCPGTGDDCQHCIPATEGTYAGSTLDNTPSAADPPCAYGGGPVIDEWYCYTAGCDGTARASLCSGADFDTTLAVFDACENGPPIACNDDDCGYASVVSWPVEAGQTYSVRVAGFGGSSGNYELTLECLVMPPAQACPADADGDGEVGLADLVQVLNDWGCTKPPGPCLGDVSQDGTSDVADLLMVILHWGECP